MAADFYLRYYVGHRGKFGHEFLEFELLPNGRLRYANNSQYKNDTLISKECFVHPHVVTEVINIVKESEIAREDDNKWPEPDRVGKQELEIVVGDKHLSFTTNKIGSLTEIANSDDPDVESVATFCTTYLVDGLLQALQLLSNCRLVLLIMHTIYQRTMPLNADVLLYNSDLRCLLCGMYELDTKTNSRKGAIEIIALSADDPSTVSRLVDADGVLDMIFMQTSVLLTAEASGNLCCYRCSSSEDKADPPVIERISSARIGDAILTRVDSLNDVVACSSTDGSVRFLDCSSLKPVSEFPLAHNYEAWCVHIDRNSPQTAYSGSDDCYINSYDYRSPQNQAVSRIKGADAGVTEIFTSQLLPPHMLLTGGYDDHLRIWDKRCFKKSVESASLAGGVWRIKQCPLESYSDWFLVCCMYAGVKLVQLRPAEQTMIQQVRELIPERSADKHENSLLWYGIDWLDYNRGETQRDKLKFAACSFYDKNLVTCEFPLSFLNGTA